MCKPLFVSAVLAVKDIEYIRLEYHMRCQKKYVDGQQAFFICFPKLQILSANYITTT